MTKAKNQTGCTDCLGTGIGWNGPDSNCRICSGTGIARQSINPNEDAEEPWNVDLEEDKGATP